MERQSGEPVPNPELECQDRNSADPFQSAMSVQTGRMQYIKAISSNVVSPLIENCTVNSLNIITEINSSINNSSEIKGRSLTVVQEKIKKKLKTKYENIFEGRPRRGNSSALRSIYTELYITKGECKEVNIEHEVWQVEAAFKKSDQQDTAINCNDIFKPHCEGETIKTVLMKGIAGIGKTVSVQKFILDWAQGCANSNITFIFPLPFRELNRIKDKKLSLLELIQFYHPEMKDIQTIDLDELTILFVFDGLDECRLPLDFQNNETLCSKTEATSVDVLLTNLINGNLLSSALLWVTSRPAAVSQIPHDCIHLVTEIRGFNDEQKEMYFKNRYSNDEKLAARIIEHVKVSRSLYIMCHMPFFCWISANVLGQMLKEAEADSKKKTSLTQMYTSLLLLQTNIKNQKYYGANQTNQNKMSVSDKDITLKLGKLAFQQLRRSNFIFYEEDLTECDIDVNEASLYSGLFTELFREEFGFFERNIFCFVHLSIQEYLAALFVHYRYATASENLLNSSISRETNQDENIDFYPLHKSAMDEALQSPNGHLDLFLRFLLGISLDNSLLPGLLKGTKCASQIPEKTIKCIKQEIRKNPSPERAINLFHCLNELNDNTLVDEIKSYLDSGSISDTELSGDQCSALAYVLLTSEHVLENLDLSKYNASSASLRRLLPVLKFSRKACLHHCRLTKVLLDPVLLVLRSPNSLLVELDLSYNKLGDAGVKQLCNGIKGALCRLQSLGLGDCNLTGKSCEYLASVLRSELSGLRDLELRGNDLEDSGVELLCSGLKDTHCKLQRLGLLGCRVTEKGCASLASALRVNPSHLRELDLSYNYPGDSGVALLTAELDFKLEKLIVEFCGQQRNKPGPQKYACQLSLDLNTAFQGLILSEENRKVTKKGMTQYPDHPERFDCWSQVLCREGLTGRCYWEVEWEGGAVDISVAYRGMSRKGRGDDSAFGYNAKSWNLHFSGDVYHVRHDKKITTLPLTSSGPSKVGVYLDWPAGILSFYRIVRLHQMYELHTRFTEPVYPGFSVSTDRSLSLSSMN